RRGIDKDERAKSIEREEVDRLEKDLQDEIADVELERDQKLKNILVGKTLTQDLAGQKEPILGKRGQKIERAWLDELDWQELTRVKVKEDDTLGQSIRRIAEAADESIEYLRSDHQLKIDRVQRGDDLPPGVIKMVKVYVAVKRKLSIGDKMA